ncbi:hypothetical protein D3C86_1713140 [compost metagenome]
MVDAGDRARIHDRSGGVAAVHELGGKDELTPGGRGQGGGGDEGEVGHGASRHHQGRGQQAGHRNVLHARDFFLAVSGPEELPSGGGR